MKSIKSCIVLAAGLLTGTAAHAEVFNGFYVGGEVGYDQYEAKATDLFDSGISADGLSANGFVGGVYAGYDLSFNESFFGSLEAGFTYSDADLSASVDTDSGAIGAREAYGVSGRLGAMINDSTALYARVGWENTKFKASDGTTTISESENGILFGAGLETRVSANTTIRVEYSIVDYGSDIGEAGSGIKVTNGRVRAGVSFRF